MREIEFRGLRKDGKGWVYGVPFHIHEEDKCFIIDNCMSSNFKQDETEFTGYEVHPKTVGQYTGVDDFNGENLYEGDKVSWVDSDGETIDDVIVWMNGGLVLCNGSYTVGSYIGKKLKKVGNIHEGGEE